MVKFSDLAGLVIGTTERARLGAAVMGLDEMKDMRELLPLLQESCDRASLDQMT
jgi:hypothetical protein